MATFTNQATLSFQDTVVSSNIVTGEINSILSVQKTALNDSYLPGGSVTYAVSVFNNGETAYQGLTLTDDLGAYALADGTQVTPLDYVAGSVRYFSDGVLMPAPAAAADGPLTVSGITVPGNGNALILYQAGVNAYAPFGEAAQLTNTVTVTGDRVTEPVTDRVTVPAAQGAVLSISKALDPVSVDANGRLTYTFVMENRGLTEASGDTVFSDVFDPVLGELNVSYNGTVWQEGVNYTYAAGEGIFTSVAGEIVVPAATAAQDPATGLWTVTPGTAVLVITGTV